MNLENYTVIDAETTTFNRGHPFDPRNKLISYAYKHSDSLCVFKYHTDPDFQGFLEQKRRSNTTFVGFNFKFDCHWLYPSGLVNPIWDCQLAEHVFTGQKAQFISLNECLEKYGLETKLDVVKEYWDAGIQTDDIPIEILQEYNEWDVIQTEKLYHIQQSLLTEEQKNLVLLMGEDLKVLAHVERAGFRFDSEKAKAYLESCRKKVTDLEQQLAGYLPTITHGVFNFDSGDHLSAFLYGGTLEFDYAIGNQAVYKSGEKKGQEYIRNRWYTEQIHFLQRFLPLAGTETKKTKDDDKATTRVYQTDLPTLQSIKAIKAQDRNIVDILTARSALQKVVEMLESLFKQFNDKGWEGNLVHGTYNQNVAVTGRLSSSAPNMQNSPPEIDKFFVSRYV